MSYGPGCPELVQKFQSHLSFFELEKSDTVKALNRDDLPEVPPDNAKTLGHRWPVCVCWGWGFTQNTHVHRS